VTYDQFRTGLTYEAVWKMLWVDNPDPSTWPKKNKGAVLSLWRQLKRDLWEEFYQRGIDPETLPPPRPVYRVPHNRPLLTVRQAANVLGMTDDQVLWAIGHGGFPGAFCPRRHWRAWLIPRSAVLRSELSPASQAG